ncbi:MAG TPA: acyl carrier protein [Puia sp.]|nr:acyl carrier protein [Puia sp.]
MNTVVDKSGISTRVKAIIVDKLGVDESMLTSNASFTNDLGLDSLDVLETFMALEKEFGVRIADEDMEKLTTMGSVIDYIIEHKN